MARVLARNWQSAESYSPTRLFAACVFATARVANAQAANFPATHALQKTSRNSEHAYSFWTRPLLAL